MLELLDKIDSSLIEQIFALQEPKTGQTVLNYAIENRDYVSAEILTKFLVTKFFKKPGKKAKIRQNLLDLIYPTWSQTKYNNLKLFDNPVYKLLAQTQ